MWSEAGIELVTHRNHTGELTRERAGPVKLDSVKLFFRHTLPSSINSQCLAFAESSKLKLIPLLEQPTAWDAVWYEHSTRFDFAIHCHPALANFFLTQVLEENSIVAEVTFGETAGGKAILQGSYVSADKGE